MAAVAEEERRERMNRYRIPKKAKATGDSLNKTLAKLRIGASDGDIRQEVAKSLRNSVGKNKRKKILALLDSKPKVKSLVLFPSREV